MSLEQGTKLRNGKVIFTQSAMTEPNTTDSDSNDNSDIFSQLTELKENYERKIIELQSEFNQLKDLMALISKSNEDSPSSSSRGTSKQPRSRLDNRILYFSVCDNLVCQRVTLEYISGSTLDVPVHRKCRYY